MEMGIRVTGTRNRGEIPGGNFIQKKADQALTQSAFEI
jgi:hypothetical protein